ncbi:hypothetical protein LMQ14_20185 [Mycobacterium sp. Aquia_213]|nr:hypothetical protein [Mycobacterium sp. Aquia_213]WAC90229.1 hypothetical protein LMQ14_20185 [Mycobacterium sp. Aquia_213]
MKQHPRRRLVNALRRRDKDRPGVLDENVDLCVVKTVASQAIYLVDNHIIDRVLLDVREHALQLGPSIRRFCRLSPLDEFLDYRSAERVGFAPVGLKLRWQGVALGIAIALRLILRRNTGVGDGDFGIPGVRECLARSNVVHGQPSSRRP